MTTERTLREDAPDAPGAEDWIKKNKAEFKKRYGKKWERVLYAKAWILFGKKAKNRDESAAISEASKNHPMVISGKGGGNAQVGGPPVVNDDGVAASDPMDTVDNDQPSNPKAIIITDDLERVAGNPEADRFYGELEKHLKSLGYEVAFDRGRPGTLPKKADLWLGHGRGADRLRFAPASVKTIAIGTGHNDSINHPSGKVDKAGAKADTHFSLTDEMRREISRSVRGDKQDVVTEMTYLELGLDWPTQPVSEAGGLISVLARGYTGRDRDLPEQIEEELESIKTEKQKKELLDQTDDFIKEAEAQVFRTTMKFPKELEPNKIVSPVDPLFSKRLAWIKKHTHGDADFKVRSAAILTAGPLAILIAAALQHANAKDGTTKKYIAELKAVRAKIVAHRVPGN